MVLFMFQRRLTRFTVLKRLVPFLRIKLPEEAEIPMALTSLIMELKFQH